MPEPLELSLCGFERCRMLVPEPDDGDSGNEVEVALAVFGDQPAAVAVDERDWEARVGRREGAPVRTVIPSPPSCRSTRAHRRARR